MAAVRRVGLFSREIVERLSPASMELMLALATKLSEGQILAGGHYFGSTMLTIDLDKAAEHLREPGDAATALKLSRLLARNDTVLDQVRALAHEEASRVAGSSLRSCEIDVRVRVDERRVFVDVDVEGRLAGEGDSSAETADG